MEEKIFKKLSTKENVDLISYIKEYMEKYPETQILIGADSQNRRRQSIYAICIGLNRPGKGAHVLYTKYEVPRIKENRDRLIKETWDAIEIAEYIREFAGYKATFIDIDVNPDSKYGSNSVLAA